MAHITYQIADGDIFVMLNGNDIGRITGHLNGFRYEAIGTKRHGNTMRSIDAIKATLQPYAMRDRRSGLYLAMNDKDPYKYGGGVAKVIGVRGHYRWVRDIKDAIVYMTEPESEMDWIMMGEPPVDFVNVE